MKKRKIRGYTKKKMQLKKWLFIIFDDTELFEEKR